MIADSDDDDSIAARLNYLFDPWKTVILQACMSTTCSSCAMP